MDYCSPGSSVHGISQARILEKVAIFFPRGSSLDREPESPVFPALQVDSLPADVSRKKIFSLLFLRLMLKFLIVKLFD